MRHLFGKAIVLVATMLSMASASAALIHLQTNLSGANENPPVATPGTGVAFVDVDTTSFIMTVQATFSGLLGTTTASHIHCCAAPPANVGVATTTPSFVGFPLGVTSGSFVNTYDLSLASSYNPAFVTAQGGTIAGARTALIDGMLAGQSYFNIHTTVFGGGEIRGQLAVPEPWSVALFGAGLAAALVSRRRRH